ncbi:twin transmembrane helix small protein [Marinobacteraceae bacterium S3BR75-40.1]
MLKILIVVLLIGVVISLFSGLFFLLKDDSSQQRTVNALIVRVTLSVLLLLVIGIALWTGQLHMNHGPLP